MISKLTISMFLMAASLVFIFHPTGSAQPADIIEVYYFHGQFRCHSCTASRN